MRQQQIRFVIHALVAAVPVFAFAPLALAEDAEAGLKLFRESVEPILKKRCFDCHSHDAGEASGGLMLDSQAGWKVGGDTGPAIVPGKPEESLFIRAINHTDAVVEMPPDGRLPAEEVKVLTEWVRLGAPDPRTSGTATAKQQLDLQAGREHWCYQPVERTEPPRVKNADWPRGAIDQFILAGLEERGIAPAAEADRATLVRRLYFDLIGLPPTPEEIDAFVSDTSPDAYEQLVDRLLTSRDFGERWGRHWLDIARFAESVTLRGLVFSEAWRYRDYVIDSFDRDVPIDRFIKEQIAGDLLPAETTEDRTRQVVATAYLMVGNWNLEDQDKKQLHMDVVDEQLDVITKGLLGQTVTCARCHDHKFDPIPTHDYYAMAGILANVRALRDANVSQWIEMPLPARPEVEAAVKEYESAVAALETQISAVRKQMPPPGAASKGRSLPVEKVPGVVVDDANALKVGEWKDSSFTRVFVGEGYTHDLNADKGTKTITYQAELPVPGEYDVWLSYSVSESRAKAVPVTVFSADGETTVTVDMSAPPTIADRFVSLGRYRFEKDGISDVLITNEGTVGYVTPDAVAFVPVNDVASAIRKLGGASTDKPNAEAATRLASLEAELKSLKQKAPERPMAMTVEEAKQATDLAIHVRGSVHSLGAMAPRGFLQVASYGPTPAMPEDQSGRVQLAEWIASSENPLTARVFVNRVWHWLMGSGLVRTVDNFGTTGETPSHPELLDYLASEFVADGWSAKKLVRRIVLSRTYRQAAIANAEVKAVDPENRHFSRANRKRLDAECLRDAMLAVGGTLTELDGGPTFKNGLASDYGQRVEGTYRSVYLPVFRNSLPDIFEAFDFANPSTVTGRRNTSTVPQQALFMLNNPFTLAQADAAAKRVVETDGSQEERVVRAYRLTLGREPSSAERYAVVRFLDEYPESEVAAWSRVFQSLFASPDFRFIE